MKQNFRRKLVGKIVFGGSWCERESQEEVGVKESLRRKWV